MDEVLGDGNEVNGVIVKSVNNNKNSSIEVKGVFIAIVHNPNTEIFSKQLEMDQTNYILLDKSSNRYSTQTSLEGVFAAGDVADPIYRQAVTSAGSGCMAALDAEKYLDNLS